MNCKVCLLDNEFWENVESPENERLLIKEFYAHKFDAHFSCLNTELKLCSIDSCSAIREIFRLLNKYSCNDILSIISEDFKEFKIEAKDILQFSDFTDAYYLVVRKILDSGLNNLTYERVGFLLRKPNTNRTSLADHKYGENHAKTAVAMGLCSCDKKFQLNVTDFGRIFNELTTDEQYNMMSKLCLYIPIVQNIIVNGNYETAIDHYLSILSESTRVRRRSSLRVLVAIVSENIENGL